MKPPVAMSGVELLTEFCAHSDYMELVRQCREQGVETYLPLHSSRLCFSLKKPGKAIEVMNPTAAMDERWEALCAEINTRLGNGMAYKVPK